MAKLLEQAISRLKSLPAHEQDAIAVIILEELEDEARWEPHHYIATDGKRC